VDVSRDCPNFLGPPIISGTRKATDFKFCTHIHRIDRNKSLLEISGKVAVGVPRDSRNFSGHPYIGASRGHLYGSSAFLFNIFHVFKKS